MVEITHVQGIAASIAIGIHQAVWRCFPGDQWHQRFGTGVIHDLGVDFATAFQDAKDSDLAGSSSTALTLADTTEITLIQFNRSIEHFMFFLLKVMCNCLTQFAVKLGCTVGLSLPEQNSRAVLTAVFLITCNELSSLDKLSIQAYLLQPLNL